jgi:hypothetical protein
VKFKSLFIVFNAVLLIFLAVLCLIPAFVLGGAFAELFWQTNWYLIIVLLIILIGFDAYFIVNWQLYALLEREDWPALVSYLEDRVIRQGKYSSRLVRLLANTYLVLSDSPSVMSLENKAAIARPSLVDENVLVFGTARILSRDIPGAIRFFESHAASAKPRLKPWIGWYYGFSLMLGKQFDEAAQAFTPLASDSPDAVVTALSSYFLATTLAKLLPGKAPGYAAVAAGGKERVRKALPDRARWFKETAKLSTEIHAAAIAKYMEEAGAWIYAE